MKRVRGFTLIELVIIIVLIGILSSVALPRFVDISSDAHAASVKATAAAIKTALELAHNKWVVSGKLVTTESPLALNGLTLGSGSEETGFSSSGWVNSAFPGAFPDKTAILGAAGADNEAICAQIFKNLLSDSSVSVSGVLPCSSATADYCATYTFPAGKANCIYTYQGDTVVTRTITYTHNDNGKVAIAP